MSQEVLGRTPLGIDVDRGADVSTDSSQQVDGSLDVLVALEPDKGEDPTNASGSFVNFASNCMSWRSTGSREWISRHPRRC